MVSARICFIGDSLVNGSGDPDFLGWSGRLCAAARRAGHEVTRYDLGVRRDTSADIAARWRREAEARLPDEYAGRLVFSFGMNDCAAGEDGSPRLTSERSLAYARAILSEAAAWKPTLMVGPPPACDDPAMDVRIRRLADGLGGVCREVGVPWLDVFDTLVGDATWRREAAAGDGTHPGAGGYGVLAGRVEAWPPWRAWFAPGG